MSKEAARRKYRNPPITEAVCEFRFVPGQEWDLTIPGKVHERLRESYSGKPKQQRMVQAQLSPKDGGLSVSELGLRVQLVDSKGERLLTLGPDLISVHVFQPYKGWEVFREGIFEAFRAYREVAEPKGVSRIGLRYINKIKIPETEVELADYFTKPPVTPDEFPEPMTKVQHRSEAYYNDNVRLIFNLSSVRDPDSMTALFLVDLDLEWSGEDPLEDEADIRETLEDLRNKERQAFEALITDRTRELFDEHNDEP